jgi:hypothetical protein
MVLFQNLPSTNICASGHKYRRNIPGLRNGRRTALDDFPVDDTSEENVKISQ